MLLTPYVLAGGRSTRMGRDKAFVPFEGMTLLEHALRRARALGVPRILSGDARDEERRDRLRQFAPTVPDHTAGAGPLAGIDAALQDSPTEWLLILPVDQPCLPATALEEWIAEAEQAAVQAAWFTHPGGTEPLPLLLHRSLAEAIGMALLGGERRVLPVVQASAPRSLGVFRPRAEWFRNLNRPTDLSSTESALDVVKRPATGRSSCRWGGATR